MGLLIEGQPLMWEQMKQYRDYIKKHGTKQFINIWRKYKDRSGDKFFWGDEVETLILHMDKKKASATIALRASEILDSLHALQEEIQEATPDTPLNATFHPEYGNFMVEATPGLPYGGYSRDLCLVEPNMRLRRCLISSKLEDDERVVTMSNFPLLGVNTDDYQFSTPAYPTGGDVCKSNYIHDYVMSPHPRFATLSGNIRRRREKRVNIKHPLFIDTNTDTTPGPTGSAGNSLCLDERDSLKPRGDEIHMDAMVFGMGCCCLQVTFQTRSIDEARNLYDQLGVISPLFLALTANTPFHRGRIADTDVRWDTISSAVDDRTDEECSLTPLTEEDRKEQGITPALPISQPASPEMDAELTPVAELEELDLQATSHHNDARDDGDVTAEATPTSTSTDTLGQNVGIGLTSPYGPLSKSRYSSIDCYIGREQHYRDEYNNLPFKYDSEVYSQLHDAGIDTLLGKHIASLFVRDPLVVFKGKVHVDDEATTEHFESIQSTNWRSVRFKPPPLGDQIGWRVEFRTMEVQVTDFENAAFTVFIALLTRAISYFDINFYIPLSQVEENFKTAHGNDASRKGLFHMRKVITQCVKAESDCNSILANTKKGVKRTTTTPPTNSLSGLSGFTNTTASTPKTNVVASIPCGLSNTSFNSENNMNTTDADAVSVGSTQSELTLGVNAVENRYDQDTPLSPTSQLLTSTSAADLCRINSQPFQWETSKQNPYVNHPIPIACPVLECQSPSIACHCHTLSEGEGDVDEDEVAYDSRLGVGENVSDINGSPQMTTPQSKSCSTTSCPSTASSYKSLHDESCSEDISNCSELMTMEEIFCGKAPHYPGLIPLVRAYLDIIKCDIATRRIVDKYICLIEKRAKGELLTGAQFLRQFARSHPSYKFDSKLTPDMAYEMALLSDLAAQDIISLPELMGTLNFETRDIYDAIVANEPDFLSNIGIDVPEEERMYYSADNHDAMSCNKIHKVLATDHSVLQKIMDDLKNDTGDITVCHRGDCENDSSVEKERTSLSCTRSYAGKIAAGNATSTAADFAISTPIIAVPVNSDDQTLALLPIIDTNPTCTCAITNASASVTDEIDLTAAIPCTLSNTSNTSHGSDMMSTCTTCTGSTRRSKHSASSIPPLVDYIAKLSDKLVSTPSSPQSMLLGSPNHSKKEKK